MNIALLAFLGWPETIAILVVVLVLFGAKKLPELARGLGQGIKEFKKATREVQEDLTRAIEEEPPSPRQVTPPPAESGQPVSQSPSTPSH